MGGIVSAFGEFKQAGQAKKTGAFNRRLSTFQAQDALLRGVKEEERYRREIAMVAGQQSAEFGARNVAASGTALDILADTAQVGEEDALTIRNNAAREAWGYRMQAKEATRLAKNQATNSYMRAAGTLLTTGAQANGQWGS